MEIARKAFYMMNNFLFLLLCSCNWICNSFEFSLNIMALLPRGIQLAAGVCSSMGLDSEKTTKNFQALLGDSVFSTLRKNPFVKLTYQLTNHIQLLFRWLLNSVQLCCWTNSSWTSGSSGTLIFMLNFIFQAIQTVIEFNFNFCKEMCVCVMGDGVINSPCSGVHNC